MSKTIIGTAFVVIVGAILAFAIFYRDSYAPGLVTIVSVKQEGALSRVWIRPPSDTYYHPSGVTVVSETDDAMTLKVYKDNINSNHSYDIPVKDGMVFEIENPKAKKLQIR